MCSASAATAARSGRVSLRRRLDGQLDPLRRLLPAPDPRGQAVDDEERRPGRALEASFPMRRDLRTYLRRYAGARAHGRPSRRGRTPAAGGRSRRRRTSAPHPARRRRPWQRATREVAASRRARRWSRSGGRPPVVPPRSPTAAAGPSQSSTCTNVTLAPSGGPKQSTPAAAASLRWKPQPDRSSSRGAEGTRSRTASASCSRVSGPARSASPIAVTSSIRPGCSTARRAAVQSESSSAGCMWSVSRVVHVFAIVRRSQSASRTSAWVIPSTRTASWSSAEPITCAWIPQMSRTTSTSRSAGARCARCERATRPARTSSQLTSGRRRGLFR